MNSLYIFLDTNVLKKIDSNLTQFDFSQTYYVLKDYIIENELKGIKVLVPKIVIEELISHYITGYKSQINKINDEVAQIQIKADKVQWEIEINKKFEKSFRDYRGFIIEEAYKFIENEGDFLEIVNFPNNEKLSKIIERSIKKKKPFYGGIYQKKPFSDAGFKDVIFLESIIQFFDDNEGEYLIATRDSFFKELDLVVEIKNSMGSIVDKETGKEFIAFLEEKLGIIDLSEYRKFAKTKYYKSAIEQALDCEILGEPLIVEKYENEDVVYIEICSKIKIYTEDIKIIVRISEEKEFVEILSENKEEVIYEWLY